MRVRRSLLPVRARSSKIGFSERAIVFFFFFFCFSHFPLNFVFKIVWIPELYFLITY